MKKPRDVLALALRNLRSGEELLCTARSYANVAPRIPDVQRSFPSMRFNTFQRDGMGHIRRTR